MSDWGIKVSQPGEDVFGPDQSLIFSSSWKLLTIVEQRSFNNVPQGGTIYNHALGYTPLFIPYTKQLIKSSRPHLDDVASFNHAFRARIGADEDNIFVMDTSTSFTGSGRVMVTSINIEEDYQAPKVNLEDSTKNGNINRDWGIKASLPGKSVYSDDLRDFSIHSGARTPMLHMVKTFTMDGTQQGYTATHNLGYPPMFFVFAKLDPIHGLYGWQVLGTAGDSMAATDNNDVTVNLGYRGSLSIVVLKDPMVI